MSPLQHSPDSSPDAVARPQPRSLADLFWSFSALALQGFGGVMAVVQIELVDRKRWLTREEFLEDWAVAQILPGPNVINMSLMIGDRCFGLRGAFSAMAGMLTFPLLLALALAALFTGIGAAPAAQGVLRGMGGVTAGMIAATGIKLISALDKNVMGLLACWLLAAATFVGIALLRVPLAWVLVVVGGTACAWAYRQLGRLKALEARP